MPDIDYLWTSNGGLLLGADGDIGATSDILTSIVDVARSRLKADLRGWKLYPIGADLESAIGQAIEEELETQLTRRVQDSLSNNFLPAGTFSVKTLSYGNTIEIYVYLRQKLVIQVIAQKEGEQLQVVAV